MPTKIEWCDETINPAARELLPLLVAALEEAQRREEAMRTTLREATDWLGCMNDLGRDRYCADCGFYDENGERKLRYTNCTGTAAHLFRRIMAQIGEESTHE